MTTHEGRLGPDQHEPGPSSSDPRTTPEPEDGSDSAGVPESDPGWVRRIILFLSGQTVSLFGSMVVQYAIMWYLTLETKSGTVLMFYAIFGMLPQAVVSLFGGTLADRINRKALIIAADASIAVTTVILATAMSAGHTELWMIYATLMVRSIGAGFQMPAVAAVLPQLVPSSQLMRINGINTTIQSAMALLAPAAAGAVFAVGGIVSTLWIDVATALIGIGILLTIPVPTLRRAAAEAGSYVADLVGGVRYVSGHRLVRWLLGLYAIIFVLSVAPSLLTPLMMARSFGEEVWKLTALEVTFSVGMLAGGGVVAAWFTRRSRQHMLLVATLLFGFLSIGIGLTTNLWVFLGLMLVTGLVVPFFSTPSTTLLQEKVEPEYMGRVFSFVSVVLALGMPIGMVVFGPLADVYSVESLMIVAGVASLVVVAVAFLVPAGRAALEDGRQFRANALAQREADKEAPPSVPDPADVP